LTPGASRPGVAAYPGAGGSGPQPGPP